MKANILLIISMVIVAYFLADMIWFRSRGDRFTATDGQALCERIAKLDGLSCRYGGLNKRGGRGQR